MTRDEFIERLNSLGLNKVEFSEISNVPYSTINNWGLEKKDRVIPVPVWVEPFLINYEKARKFDYIKNEVCESVDKIRVKDL